MTFTPTSEQLAIFAHCETTPLPLIIQARAGTGKTATLLELLPRLRGTTSIQAFNRAIADELRARANAMLSFEQSLNVSISTCHSHGLQAFKRAGYKPQTLSGKVQFMVKDELKTWRPGDDMQRNSRLVVKLVGAMKASGFGLVSCQPDLETFPKINDTEAAIDLMAHHGWDLEIEGDTSEEELAEFAAEILTKSNARLGSIDFDDMIYLPLLHNFKLPQYNNMLLDEAQDINATRRELAFRSVTPGGRIIAVGDDHQAIYGFTGADVSSLRNIADRAGASTLPLSICWRCDDAIISEAQTIVPDIQARPNAPAGQVMTIIWEATNEPLAGGRGFQEAQRKFGIGRDFLSLPQPGDAILCRLNKPNVAVALGLIRRGLPARIEGRDLGKKILDHVKRATPLYALQDLGLTLLDLANYKEAESQKLFEKKRESAIDLLQDEVDCATLLMERVIEEARELDRKLGGDPISPQFSHLESKVESLFGDNIASKSIITLSSVHKAKGREWSRVFILGWKDYMPFWRAVEAAANGNEWMLVQEHNLRYVGQTRAQHTLVYVNGVQSAIDRGLHREAPKAA